MNRQEPELLPHTIVLHPPPSQIQSELSKTLQTISNQVPITVFHNSPSVIEKYWSSFGRFENRIFQQQFCHKSQLSVKATGRTRLGGVFKIKEKFNYASNILKTQDYFRFLFPLKGRQQSIQLRLTDGGSRIHFDNGLININEKKVNLYGSIGFSKSWSSYNVKFGASVLSKGLEVNNRFRLGNDSFTWYHKFLYRNTNGFRIGFIGALDFSNKQLVKKDFLIGYNRNNIDVSLKLHQQSLKRVINFSNPREWYNNITLTSSYIRNFHETYAAQICYNPQNHSTVATGLFQYSLAQTKLKIKLNSIGALTVGVRNVFNNMFSLGVGGQYHLKEQKSPRIGLQLIFNI